MPASDTELLAALLDSWDRNHTILVNLLRLVPEGGLEVRGAEGSPTVARMFMHMHYVRLVFVEEDAPEAARPMPEGEWIHERDRDVIAQHLAVSAAAVREAVSGRIAAGRAMERHYDHPLLMLQHLIWHEGYHHGQIKLALKQAGLTVPDQAAGRGTWGVWMNKTKPSSPQESPS